MAKRSADEACLNEDNRDDDSDGEDGDEGGDGSEPKKATKRRRKINIEYIEDKSRRQITFSKRKAGLMKKVICFLKSPIFRLLIQILSLCLKTYPVRRTS
tara:strand:+ start:1695 stop:1994 length:300 start_codon:yes stop_codon:yes gene_type:complete